jgi:hypothetical protein
MYPENGRLNVGIEEERRPQTRIRVFDKNNFSSIGVREERLVSQERVRFSLPF